MEVLREETDGEEGPTVGPGGVVNHSASVQAALNAIGSGRFQWMTALIGGLGNAADATELLCLSYILPLWSEEASGTELGVLSAGMFLGMLFGGVGGGFLADRLGRRPTFLLSMGINFLFGALTSVTTHLPLILVFRLIGGVGVGASMPTVFTITSEMISAKDRGFFLNVVAAFWMIGSLYTVCMAWLIIPKLGWRLFALVCSFPAGLAFVLTALLLPESPRYLLLNNQAEKANAIFARIAHMNGRSDLTFSVEPIVKPPTRILANLAAMFSPKLRATTLELSAIWFAISFGWYGLILWMPTIFKEIEFDLDVYESTLFVQAANLPGNLVAIYFIDRVGRKPLMVASLVGSVMACLCFAFAPSKLTVIAAVCVFNMVSTIAWNALDCLSTESFPTAIRGTAFGALAGVGRVSSMLGQIVNGALIKVSVFLLLIVAVAALGVGVLASVLLPKDPMNTPLDDVVGSPIPLSKTPGVVPSEDVDESKVGA